MSTEQTHSDGPGHPGAVAHHKTDDHGDAHGHDDHGHAEEPLGPIDIQAWGAGARGGGHRAWRRGVLRPRDERDRGLTNPLEPFATPRRPWGT